MDEARRCTATNRAGERCGRAAARGALVCHMHGAGAPQVRAAAARRLQRERLNGDLGRLLEELEIDAGDRHPVEVLLDAVHRCSAMVQVLGALVGGLGTERPPVDDSTATPALWGPDHLGDGAPHVLVEMYGAWLDRAAKASKLALEAGVDERMTRLAEAQGRQIAQMLRAVVTDLGHDLNDEPVRASITRRLAEARTTLVPIPGGRTS